MHEFSVAFLGSFCKKEILASPHNMWNQFPDQDLNLHTLHWKTEP